MYRSRSNSLDGPFLVHSSSLPFHPSASSLLRYSTISCGAMISHSCEAQRNNNATLRVRENGITWWYWGIACVLGLCGGLCIVWVPYYPYSLICQYRTYSAQYMCHEISIYQYILADNETYRIGRRRYRSNSESIQSSGSAEASAETLAPEESRTVPGFTHRFHARNESVQHACSLKRDTEIRQRVALIAYCR